MRQRDPRFLRRRGNEINTVLPQQRLSAEPDGRHWDYAANRPDETLRAFLEEKVRSVRERILEDADVEIDPIYYCAGCRDGGLWIAEEVFRRNRRKAGD